MNATHKKGQCVNIYSDPISSNNYEGSAELIEYHYSTPDGLEFWTVRFEGEYEEFERFIKSINQN